MGILYPEVSAKLAKAGRSAVTKELRELRRAPRPSAASFDLETVESMSVGDIYSTVHPGTVGVPYDTLHALSRYHVIGSVLSVRINQVADFARHQPDQFEVGFKIRHRDPDKKVRPKDKRIIGEIREVIERAGGPWFPGGFETFLRALVRDSLTYDQATFEVIRERGGRPWGFVPVDAATIRRATPSEAEKEAMRYLPGEPEANYVQVMVSSSDAQRYQIVNEFGYHDLCFGVRRPRSWIHSAGYGYPELEELLVVLTNLMNAETFNSVNFTNGVHTRNILAVKSNMDQTMFSAFKRNIVALMSGVANAKRVPIVQLNPELKEEIQAIPLDRSNQEMEYREWLNWLLKVTCSGFQMDSAELGFVFGNEGQAAGIQGATIGERVALSREKGLRPLLRAIERWINQFVVQQYDEDYELVFTGFDTEAEDKRAALAQTQATTYKTLDEIRTAEGLEELPNDEGKVILNSTWLQFKQQKDMAEQQVNMFDDPEVMGAAAGAFGAGDPANATPGGMEMAGDAMGGGQMTLDNPGLELQPGVAPQLQQMVAQSGEPEASDDAGMAPDQGIVPDESVAAQDGALLDGNEDDGEEAVIEASRTARRTGEVAAVNSLAQIMKKTYTESLDRLMGYLDDDA